ncbi:hypothetical protein APED_00350 [Acanthopleuribacter pedis]
MRTIHIRGRRDGETPDVIMDGEWVDNMEAREISEKNEGRVSDAPPPLPKVEFFAGFQRGETKGGLGRVQRQKRAAVPAVV